MLHKPLCEYNKPEDPIYSPAAKSSAGCLYQLGHLPVLPHLHLWRHLLAHTSAPAMFTHCTANRSLFLTLEGSFLSSQRIHFLPTIIYCILFFLFLIYVYNYKTGVPFMRLHCSCLCILNRNVYISTAKLKRIQKETTLQQYRINSLPQC